MGSTASIKIKIEKRLLHECCPHKDVKVLNSTRNHVEKVYRRVVLKTKDEKEAFLEAKKELITKIEKERKTTKTKKKKKRKKKTKISYNLSSKEIDDITQCSDPWIHLKSEFGGTLSPSEEFQTLRNNEKVTKKMSQADTKTMKDGTTVLRFQASHFENINLYHEDTLDASNMKLNKIVFSSHAVRRFIRIDISCNQLKSLNLFNDSSDKRLRCFVRSVNARSNLLNELKISCVGYPKLLSLDLSENDIVSPIEKDYFANMPRLRYLRMRRCGLKTEWLRNCFECLEFSLVHIDLGENNLRNFNLIKTILLKLGTARDP